MRNTLQPFRKTLYGLIAVGCLSMGLTTALSADMAEGLAFATSVKGNIQITDTKGQLTEPNLHDTLVLNGATIKTGKNAHIFFALSNGVGVGIGSSSEVIFETYVQKSFPERKERLSSEPSVSNLSIRLVTGNLAIASNQLSPLSQALVYLPSGDLRIHSATCIVQHDELGSHITAREGTITYYYPDGEKREFIVESQSIRISPQSAKLGKVTENMTWTSLPESMDKFSKATQLASQRVLFKAGDNGNPPHAVLVAPTAFYDQSIARPYEFND
ncbi:MULTISPECIES: hypothetical protein [unclassified Lentimonas]|uniref:hypothetical protein n=1 Tax=unclassified Lentimonas TaxID=2630993 RepID=UPI001328079F|nr:MULTISPECIES: hypothetical protein [unclassified Lentimonas]CAA6678344.1 Unannotated [Lentimonas sp. CC4]CAA6685436.1 Unannotated [Lentimonas sp. CC6]CAA7076884.1 Unannotated [Lentimonas sp. CC4]CAA7170718.1 Unannotated [Lentimonas sp. CC21]CAA7179720.1 Unannotated [Lentimonas sp. CC8]